MENQTDTAESGSPDGFQIDTDSTPLVCRDNSDTDSVVEDGPSAHGQLGISSNNAPVTPSCQQQLQQLSQQNAFQNQQLPAAGFVGFYMPQAMPTGQVMYVLSAQHQQPQYQRQQQQQHNVQLEAPTVVQEIPQKAASFTCHVTLSCFVFWLCGFLFGFVAYLLATRAEDNAANNQKKARILGRASLVLSALGIFSGATIIAVVIGVHYCNRNYSENTANCQETEYSVGGACYKYKDTPEYSWECSYNYDPYYYDGNHCYFNCLGRGYHYSSAADHCFKYKTPVEYQYSGCSSDYNGNTYSNGEFCFHECPRRMYPADGGCYGQKSPEYVPEYECVSEQTVVYYDGSYCYSNCSESSYFFSGYCFKQRSTGYNSTSSCGLTFDGLVYYDGEMYCYHNCSAGSYSVAGKCFDSRSTDYNSALNCSQAQRVRDFYFEFPYCYFNQPYFYYEDYS